MKQSKTKKTISIVRLQNENLALKEANSRYVRYIREKVNQLLQVMGTLSLKPEELDDNTLLDFDPIGIIANAFDQILEHLRETNRELAIARDELQAIFDATGVGISIIDMDFRILKCNEKQRALLVDKGISDVEGRYCYEVYCNKESPGLDCPAIDTMATGRSVIIREVEKKGKHFQIVTTPFKDSEGNNIGVIEVLLDITEKKRAEDAERMQREFYLAEKSKLATVVESLSDGLFVTNKEDRIISFNNTASRITGYSASEVMGLSYNQFFGMLSENMPLMEINKTLEMNIKTKDDRQLILSITSAIVKNSEGEDIGKVFTFRDITEEKQRLEIYHRTEKLVALGQLAAGIAHELNTPLGSILGYARLILKDKRLDAQQKERLEIIAEQAKRSSAIIKGLLNFARHSNPSLKNIQDADINEILSSNLKLLQAEIEKRQIHVETDFGAIPLVKIDIRQIEQALINIILNAIQAVKESGKIGIKTFAENDCIKIKISDNGPGIPEDIKLRIFDPFFTTKPVGEGTGLGLSISAGIISEHGGSIDVESVEGKGTTFIITLPVNPPLFLK